MLVAIRRADRPPSFRVEDPRREHGTLRQLLVEIAGFLTVVQPFPRVTGHQERSVDLESQFDEPNRVEQRTGLWIGCLTARLASGGCQAEWRRAIPRIASTRGAWRMFVAHEPPTLRRASRPSIAALSNSN